MSTKQLFIPEKIRVGFQNREGTYTGKLAYVIYFDQKGKLRKEKSWLGWCDLPKGYKGTQGQSGGGHWRTKGSDGIQPMDFENVPTEGFVLNKGVGGQRQSYGWNARNEYIRVYDPRDFEFEISVANLLFILRECDCSRGKGLEGKFVYSWDGTELVLLPTTCEDYKVSSEFTTLQAQKISAKALIKGATYKTKKQEELVYLGRFEKFSIQGRWRDEKPCVKKHVFATGNEKEPYVWLGSMTSLAVCVSETPVTDYAERVDAYHKSKWGTKPVRLFTKAASKSSRKKPHYAHRESFVADEGNGVFIQCYVEYDRHKENKVDHVSTESKVEIKDGVLTFTSYCMSSYETDERRKQELARYTGRGHWNQDYYRRQRDAILGHWLEPNDNALWCELESGSKFKVGYNTLIQKKVDD